MKSVLRDWVMELPLRHQGSLVAAIRGCDGQHKNDISKPIVRALRYAFMNPADEREVSKPNAFMAKGFSREQMRAFVGDMDGYPLHFITHLMNAAQIISFKSPDVRTREMFNDLYETIVDKLHLYPESEQQMDRRLTAERINEDGDLVEPIY